MTARTLTNTIVDAALNPLRDVPVTILLRASNTDRAAPAYLADARTVARAATTVTDSSGMWSVDVEPQANVVPDDTWYEVIEHVPGEKARRHLVSVPDSVGPHSVASVLIDEPATPTSSALREHLDDTDAAHAAAAVGLAPVDGLVASQVQAAIEELAGLVDGLGVDIDAEALAAAITAEAEARADADSLLSDAVAAEAAARAAADTTLQSNLDAETAERSTAISAAVAGEATDRDTAISSAVAAEAAARAAADTSEATTRADADTALTAAIAALTLDALDDADTTSSPPAKGDRFAWSGSLWVPHAGYAEGPHANRPDPTTKLPGDRWKSTDLNGGTVFVVAAGPPQTWSQEGPGIAERGRGLIGGPAIINTNLSLTPNSSVIDIPGATAQFTYKGRPVRAVLELPDLKFSVANSFVRLEITDSANAAQIYARVQGSATVADLWHGRAETPPVTQLVDGTNLAVDTAYTWKARAFATTAGPVVISTTYAGAFRGWFAIFED